MEHLYVQFIYIIIYAGHTHAYNTWYQYQNIKFLLSTMLHCSSQGSHFRDNGISAVLPLYHVHELQPMELVAHTQFLFQHFLVALKQKSSGHPFSHELLLILGQT